MLSNLVWNKPAIPKDYYSFTLLWKLDLNHLMHDKSINISTLKRSFKVIVKLLIFFLTIKAICDVIKNSLSPNKKTLSKLDIIQCVYDNSWRLVNTCLKKLMENENKS